MRSFLKFYRSRAPPLKRRILKSTAHRGVCIIQDHILTEVSKFHNPKNKLTMKRPEIRRSYVASDAEMIQTAKTLFGNFVEDNQAFAAFDPDYGGGFIDRFRNELQEAEDIAKNMSVNAELTGLSADVQSAMEKCKNYFMMFKHFVEKAFPDDVPVWKEFGYDNYDYSSKYQAEMIQFMNRLHVTATKYREQLATVSFTQERIDEINAIKRELDNADQHQENLKKNRANITQERLTKLNACWNEISEIARLGKLIFANDFGKYQRYVIYPNGQQGIPTPPPAAPQANQGQA